MSTKEKSTVASAVVKFLMLAAITVSLLFIFSGTFAWTGAWIIFGFSVLYILLMATVGMKYFPETVIGRSKTRFEHPWDKRAVIVYSIGYYSQYVVSGLDYRYGRSGDGPVMTVIGILVYAAGMALTFWVLSTNPFAVGSARIQSDRGQYLISGGPYRIVRHPMYTSSILFAIGTPLILSSFWALLLAPVVIGSFVYRSAKEDAMLAEGLEGYREYTAKVRYRLIPQIW